MLNVGIDWYSASIDIDDVSRADYEAWRISCAKLANNIAGDDNEEAMPATMYGAIGRKVSHMFYGERASSRLLCIAQSHRADDAFFVLQNDFCRVNRLDVQCTIPMQSRAGVNDHILSLTAQTAYKRSLIISDDVSLYVGSATSDRRLVVYNKSSEEGIYCRYEARFRNELARGIARYIAQYPPEDARTAMKDVILTTHHDMLHNEPEYALRIGTTGKMIYLSSEIRTDSDTTRLWLERQVRPAIRRLSKLSGETPLDLAIKHLLLLGGDNEQE